MPSTGFAPSSVVRNVRTVAELDAQSSSKRSSLDRLSDRVSDFASSPSYTFLTFLVSLEAIFLTSFERSSNRLGNRATLENR